MKKKMNVIDWLLIVLILAAVGICYRFLKSRDVISTIETTTMAYTVEIKEVSKDTASLLTIGGDVYNSTNNTHLGTLADFHYVPHVEQEYSQQQEAYVGCEYPDTYDLYLTIQGGGYETDSAIIIDGNEIRVGANVAVKGKGYAGNSFVVTVDTAYAG